MSVAALGAVVIGRNESAHLARAIASLKAQCERVVYVDSGSTDASIACAVASGVELVELDSARPFTAARARNAGFGRLCERWPEVEFVQFLDGDCELAEGWIACAARVLREQPSVAAVCGRLRERSPRASLWNRLSELEWDVPAGDAQSFGGVVLLRRRVLEEVGGFAPEMIAGEDPELATRVREAGHRIVRLTAAMASHEAGLATAAQWWRRMVRTGHSYAELAARHPRAFRGYWSRKLRSIAFWGLALPAASLSLGLLHPLALLLMPTGWTLLAVRVFRGDPRAARADAALYAVSCALAKLPQGVGALQYGIDRGRGRRPSLIEYKGPDRPRSQP